MAWLHVPPALHVTVDVTRDAFAFSDGAPTNTPSTVYDDIKVHINPARLDVRDHDRGATERATHVLF